MAGTGRIVSPDVHEVLAFAQSQKLCCPVEISENAIHVLLPQTEEEEILHLSFWIDVLKEMRDRKLIWATFCRFWYRNPFFGNEAEEGFQLGVHESREININFHKPNALENGIISFWVGAHENNTLVALEVKGVQLEDLFSPLPIEYEVELVAEQILALGF